MPDYESPTPKQLALIDQIDLNLRDFDWHYLLCCHAIVWGINKYRNGR